MASRDYSFATFSKNDFYGELNARLVDMADVGSDRRIVDLACGTGSVTQLILERLRDARDSVVIAIDQSATALKEAMEDLKDARDAAVQFVQSQVEQVSENVKESVDTIFFCNAIHYVPDKEQLLTEISRALKPGGKLAFNTAFFEGAHPPDTMVFARKWMMRSVRILRREHGLSIVRSDKVESRNQLTPEEYRELLEDNGFRIVKQEIETVPVPMEGWRDISGFKDFIGGAMPGVPMDKASQALQAGCEQIFTEMKREFVDRNWLRIVAVRV